MSSTGKEIQRTQEECIRCNRCRKHCDFLAKYQINLLDFTKKPELAQSCFLCGGCEAVCPRDLSGARIALELRQQHSPRDWKVDFLKRRYRFRNVPKRPTETLLFLGCNYPGVYPKTCARLIELCAERGIDYSIDCCKKPIVESGGTYPFRTWEQELLAQGVRRLICTCPNCYRLLRTEWETIEVISVYAFLREAGLAQPIQERAHVFFPCSDRYQREIFAEIEPFLQGGYEDSFQDVPCCGLGGNARKYEGGLVEQMSERLRAKQTSNVYTYCASCSKAFEQYALPGVYNLLSEMLGVREAVSGKYWQEVCKAKWKRRGGPKSADESGATKVD